MMEVMLLVILVVVVVVDGGGHWRIAVAAEVVMVVSL
jgi:hypothetical protein